MKLIIVLATVIIGLSLTFLPDSANAWEHSDSEPRPEPLPHDAADIPPVEMTGRAAIAVWVQCHPDLCASQRALVESWVGKENIIPAPRALTPGSWYPHWSLSEMDGRALRAFIPVTDPDIHSISDTQMVIHHCCAASLLWPIERPWPNS